MHWKGRIAGAVLGVALLAATSARAAAEPGRSLRLKVLDRVPLTRAEWERARAVVEDAFRPSGIELRFETCAADAEPDCSSPRGPAEMGLRLLRLPPSVREGAGLETGGGALVVDRASARGIAYVFFDQVERVASVGRAPVHVVLGLTIAHEIGHVLLAPGHRETGLMQARLGPREWREASMGALRFSKEDVARMREHLVWRATTGERRVAQHPTNWMEALR